MTSASLGVGGELPAPPSEPPRAGGDNAPRVAALPFRFASSSARVAAGVLQVACGSPRGLKPAFLCLPLLFAFAAPAFAQVVLDRLPTVQVIPYDMNNAVVKTFRSSSVPTVVKGKCVENRGSPGAGYEQQGTANYWCLPDQDFSPKITFTVRTGSTWPSDSKVEKIRVVVNFGATGNVDVFGASTNGNFSDESRSVSFWMGRNETRRFTLGVRNQDAEGTIWTEVVKDRRVQYSDRGMPAVVGDSAYSIVSTPASPNPFKVKVVKEEFNLAYAEWSGTGRALRLYFDKDLDTGSVPKASDFTLTVNGQPRNIIGAAVRNLRSYGLRGQVHLVISPKATTEELNMAHDLDAVLTYRATSATRIQSVDEDPFPDTSRIKVLNGLTKFSSRAPYYETFVSPRNGIKIAEVTLTEGEAWEGALLIGQGDGLKWCADGWLSLGDSGAYPVLNRDFKIEPLDGAPDPFGNSFLGSKLTVCKGLSLAYRITAIGDGLDEGRETLTIGFDLSRVWNQLGPIEAGQKIPNQFARSTWDYFKIFNGALTINNKQGQGFKSGNGQDGFSSRDDDGQQQADYSELKAQVRTWAEQTQHGQAHVDRWMRVLAAFGEGDAIQLGYTPMTAAEAQNMADTFAASRWNPIVEALTDLESRATAESQSETEPEPEPEPVACVAQELEDDVEDYSEETHNGEAHVERWLRVLQTFRGTANDATVMTAAEAQEMANDFSPGRWNPVVAAIQCLEEQALRQAMSN